MKYISDNDMAASYDNLVTSAYRDDSKVFELLLITAAACMSDTQRRAQVYQPYPDIPGIDNNFVDMIATLGSIALVNETMKVMKLAHNDQYVINKFGHMKYNILRHIIMSNNTRMQAHKITLKDASKTEYMRDIDDSSLIDDLIEFEIVHPPAVLDRFSKHTPHYLFHGSGIQNWYSIMRNGLRNYSGTKLMSAGQAYGPGVYLSNSLNVSYGYSRSTNMFATYIIVGIAQVLKPIKEYCKSETFGGIHDSGVYVVSDDSEICLKYLIGIPNKHAKHIREITDRYITDLTSEIAASAMVMAPISCKRLTTEMKYIDKSNKWHVQHVGDNNVIHVANLTYDMHILVDCGNEYPISPPYMMFMHRTNHMMALPHGSVNYDKLWPKQWASKTKIIDVLNEIDKQMTDNINIDATITNDISNGRNEWRTHLTTNKLF